MLIILLWSNLISSKEHITGNSDTSISDNGAFPSLDSKTAATPASLAALASEKTKLYRVYI